MLPNSCDYWKKYELRYNLDESLMHVVVLEKTLIEFEYSVS